jgi:hypothetical protein
MLLVEPRVVPPNAVALTVTLKLLLPLVRLKLTITRPQSVSARSTMVRASSALAP